MKRLFVCLFILIFVMVAQAQFKFEVTQEMKKKQAEITITGKTFDENSYPPQPSPIMRH